MIEIEVKARNGEMEIYSVGHSQGHEMSDEICASVSAIMQTAVLGLEKISENYPDQVSIKINDIYTGK